MGIEPTCPAWKAGVLPLNYTRKQYKILKYNAQSRNRTKDTRIFSPLLYQLSYLGTHSPALCLRESSYEIVLVGHRGLEPRTCRL